MKINKRGVLFKRNNLVGKGGTRLQGTIMVTK